MDTTFIRRVIPYRTPPQGISTIHFRPKSRQGLFLFFVLCFSIVGLTFSAAKVSAVNNDPTSYPYKSGPICQIDGTNCVADAWSFYQRQCVSYAAWRVNSNHNSTSSPYYFRNTMFGSTEDLKFGNAGHWDNAIANAIAGGTNTWFYYDNVPSVGAIAVWDPYSTTGGVQYIGSAGHVAYVESVNLNGTVNVSEYNYKGDSNYGTRGSTAADHYIHFNSPFVSNIGGLKGTIYYAGNLINYRQTLVTASVSSSSQNNTDFYYQQSYFGTYNMALPKGYITLRATDGINSVTIKNLVVTDLGWSYDITLNNKCIDAATGATLTNCDTPVYVASANTGGGMIMGGVTVTGTVCTSAPSTSSNVTGATQGNNGWWRSATTVSLYASAPCGINGLKTYYSINGGSSQIYSGPFNLNQEGIYTITFHSVDGLGNTEGNKSIQVKMDWTPPATTGTATGPRDTNGIFRDTVTAGLNATDNLSGVDYNQRSIDGGTSWITQTGNNNTFQITGNGVSRFLFRSVDKAGNTEQQKDSGPIIINKYVVFSNGTSNSLRFIYNTGVNITGEMYSGGTALFDGNTGSAFGTTLKTVGTTNSILNTNTNVTYPQITTSVQAVPMLSYPLSLYQSLATVVFPSDLYMDSVGSTLKGIYYVQGNVKMYNVALGGPVSIVSTGTITDFTTDSTFISGDPHNGILLYAGQNIDVNSTGNRNLGLLYAPNGTIYIRSTNLNLQGSLVANQVELNAATTFNLTYNAAFSSSTYNLPLTAMVLSIDKPATQTLPAVPTLYKPTNASMVSGTTAKVTWNAVTNAVGYQVQVSKSSAFDTLVFNQSQFTTSSSVKSLTKGIKYYWRVRSINEAGMSNWSNVWSFTMY